MYKDCKLTSSQAIFFLLLGFTCNALGMGMTVASNLGSAMWTASSVNIAIFFDLSLATVLIIYGSMQIIINGFLLRNWQLYKIVGNLVVTLFFGSFVGLFSHLFMTLGFSQWPVVLRLLADGTGIVCVGIGISISQRVNLLLHPWDELTNILRFKYFKGDVRLGQLTAFGIPLVMTLILWLMTGRMVAVNIGTICVFLCQGNIIGWADTHCFKHLVHRMDNVKKEYYDGDINQLTL